MTRRGHGSLALGTLLASACKGGFVGFAVLALVAPLLAKVALRFSSFAYFWLAPLGLSCAALISSGGWSRVCWPCSRALLPPWWEWTH